MGWFAGGSRGVLLRHLTFANTISLQQVNNILASFKRLKTNAAEGGKPYREDTVEYKDVVNGLNIVVRMN